MPKKVPQAAAAGQIQQTTHKLAQSNAIKMVKKFQKVRKELMAAKAKGQAVPAGFPEIGISFAFNAKAIKQLLKKPGAVGIRIYPAVNAENNLTLVLTAFDADGNNISIPDAAAAKALKAAGALGGAEDDSSTLDDAQINPPYNSPSTP